MADSSLPHCEFLHSSVHFNHVTGSSCLFGRTHHLASCSPDTTRTVAPGTIGTALLQRQWAGLSAQGHEVQAEPFDPYSMGQDIYLAGLDIEVRMRFLCAACQSRGCVIRWYGIRQC